MLYLFHHEEIRCHPEISVLVHGYFKSWDAFLNKFLTAAHISPFCMEKLAKGRCVHLISSKLSKHMLFRITLAVFLTDELISLSASFGPDKLG